MSHDELPQPFQYLDGKLEGLRTRMGKLERMLIVLTLLVVAPKVGAPEPSQVVAAVFRGVGLT